MAEFGLDAETGEEGSALDLGLDLGPWPLANVDVLIARGRVVVILAEDFNSLFLVTVG